MSKNSNSQLHFDTTLLNDQHKIRSWEIVKEKLLGEGAFARVYKGKCRHLVVAIKELQKEISQETFNSFLQEVSIMRAEVHPNVVSLCGVCTDSANLMIITEFVPKGNLENFLRKHHGSISHHMRLKFAKDIALGMNWLHKSTPQCLHRDLKPANLLVTENNRIKICDFGFSELKKPWTRRGPDESMKGTFNYLAPEIINQGRFDEKCDVYSYGITLWNIWTARLPYSELDHLSNDTFIDYILSGHRPEIEPDFPKSISSLMVKCWDQDPRKRPPFDQIIEQIDHMLIEEAIQLPIGQEFWKENFFGKDSVSWNSFTKAWSKKFEATEQFLPDNPTMIELRSSTDSQLLEFSTRSLGNQRIVDNLLSETPRKISSSSQLHYDCLRELLLEKDSVNIELFGRVLSWFGPVYDEKTNEFILFNTIESILREPWFHGPLSLQKTEDLLNNGDRYFLVRFSSKQNGTFTLSFSQDHKVFHSRIVRTTRGFEVGEYSCSTLPGLINLIAEKSQLVPILGSPYLRIFGKASKSNYVTGIDSNTE